MRGGPIATNIYSPSGKRGLVARSYKVTNMYQLKIIIYCNNLIGITLANLKKSLS